MPIFGRYLWPVKCYYIYVLHCLFLIVIIFIYQNIFYRNIFYIIVDIDECNAYENPCGTNAICKNAIPGYECICPPGYSPRPTSSIACVQVMVLSF